MTATRLTALLVIMAGLSAGSCAEPGPVPPVDRTMAVVTSGCGAAPATIGSAVLLGDGIALTAAHVVAGADVIGLLDAASLPAERTWPAFSPGALLGEADEASILALDTVRDLAIVSTGATAEDMTRELEPAVAAADTSVWIHGVASPDPALGIVAERTVIVTDEVRGSDRVERDGYRLTATTERGDSGAGLWTVDDRLVGMVFAVSTADDRRTWAVSGLEIAAFIDEIETSGATSFRCREAESRVVAES